MSDFFHPKWGPYGVTRNFPQMTPGTKLPMQNMFKVVYWARKCQLFFSDPPPPLWGPPKGHPREGPLFTLARFQNPATPVKLVRLLGSEEIPRGPLCFGSLSIVLPWGIPGGTSPHLLSELWPLGISSEPRSRANLMGGWQFFWDSGQ